MTHNKRMSLFTAVVISALWSPVFGDEAAARPRREKPALVIPSRVTPYDIATPRELFYRRHVAPTIAGHSIANWSLWQGVEEQVGDWINPFLEASRISNTISESFPIGNQEPTKELEGLVRECAEVLGLQNPATFIRNSPLTAAYAHEVDGRATLTLTSGLLSLYEGRPDELRFIVGRELGHIKCGHVGLRVNSYAVVAALQHVNLAVVPDEYQAVLPTLALGRLLSLFRELEFSADRAGLLCCQDAGTAYQAMLRQLHGLNAASTWIDPRRPEFDPQKYLKAIEDWEDRPLVKFIQEVRRYSSQSPFVPERIAQLAVWAESPEYREILGRTEGKDAPDPNQLVTIDTIVIRGIADQEEEVDPYVIAYSEDERLFHTRTASGLKSVEWKGVNQTSRILDNQPVFFEIWHDGLLSNTFIGGFVIYPRKPMSKPDEPQRLRAPIEWDWKTRVETSRLGSAEVLLKYSTRAKDRK